MLILLILSGYSLAQGPVKVDPKHHKVEFENDQVSVLRITLGPKEKSAMHYHPEGMVIYLTDGKGKFTYPDGKNEKYEFKKASFKWVPALTHQGENVSDKTVELLQIEMKTKK
ncbi:MAG: cupin domain-containing protein [Ignavibacteriaceae bacterium]|nr:cupin domain-containing protein [Ignavibacteriaceae bacterium]